MAGASGVGFGAVAVGFVVSFVVAIVVVRAFVHYISRHGFAPFAWYRIVAGVAGACLADDALKFILRPIWLGPIIQRLRR